MGTAMVVVSAILGVMLFLAVKNDVRVFKEALRKQIEQIEKDCDFLNLPRIKNIMTAKQFRAFLFSAPERIYFVDVYDEYFGKKSNDTIKKHPDSLILEVPEKDICFIATPLLKTPIDEWDRAGTKGIMMVDTSENKDFSKKAVVLFSNKEETRLGKILREKAKSQIKSAGVSALEKEGIAQLAKCASYIRQDTAQFCEKTMQDIQASASLEQKRSKPESFAFENFLSMNTENEFSQLGTVPALSLK